MSLSEQGVVDTHHHLWLQELAERSWLEPDYGLLYRSFDPDDLAEASRDVGVTRCVLVEAGNTDEENRGLECMAGSSDLIAAVMPHLDLDGPAIDKELDRWERSPKFRGVRMGLEGHPDPGVLARPAMVEGLGRLAARGLIFEFLVRTHHLPDVLKVYESFPELKGIINHMAKPDMAEGTDRAEWRSSMRDLARNTNVCCKISLSPRAEQIGKLAARPGKGWPVESITPYVQWLLEQFGADRLMWGSDWPIALITSDYKGTYEAMREAVGPVPADVESRLFSRNAVGFYGLS